VLGGGAVRGRLARTIAACAAVVGESVGFAARGKSADPFVGTWRHARPGNAVDDYTMFIAKTGPDYEATLYASGSTGAGSFVVRVPLVRMGEKLTSRKPSRNTLTIVRRNGGRVGVTGYDAPEEMVRTSTATNPIFE
jgi:hypothetical protein